MQKAVNRAAREGEVAAGVCACRRGRASRRPERTVGCLSGSEIFQRNRVGAIDPPGGTPRLYGRRGRPPLPRLYPNLTSEFGLTSV